MKPRILIFEDDDILRTTLKHLLDSLDYDVHTFSNPGMCPLFYSSNLNCLLDDSCSDIILSDVNMPVENGLEFMKKRFSKRCKMKYHALISADWNDLDLQYAEEIGCKVFSKPFDVEDLLNWIGNCRRQIDHNRILSDRSGGEPI